MPQCTKKTIIDAVDTAANEIAETRGLSYEKKHEYLIDLPYSTNRIRKDILDRRFSDAEDKIGGLLASLDVNEKYRASLQFARDCLNEM